MTTLLHVSALSADDLNRIRERGVDDFGNPLVVTVNPDPGGTPLRCCLRDAAVGERVALLAWQPSPLPGAYAEVGPVFVHADQCAGWTGRGYPEGFRGRRQLLRSYDGSGRVVDNEIVDGGAAAEAAPRPRRRWTCSSTARTWPTSMPATSSPAATCSRSSARRRRPLVDRPVARRGRGATRD